MELTNLDRLIEGFIHNKPIRVGNYFVEGKELVYKALTERQLTFSIDDKIRSKQVAQLKSAIKNGIAFVDDHWSTLAHAGREHADLQLQGWFRAVPNTATQSWTIRGDVD